MFRDIQRYKIHATKMITVVVQATKIYLAKSFATRMPSESGASCIGNQITRGTQMRRNISALHRGQEAES
jgi:hypothetical protein